KRKAFGDGPWSLKRNMPAAAMSSLPTRSSVAAPRTWSWSPVFFIWKTPGCHGRLVATPRRNCSSDTRGRDGIRNTSHEVWSLRHCPTGRLQVLRDTEGDHPALWVEWKLLRQPLTQEGPEWPPCPRVPDESSRCSNWPRSSATSRRRAD